RTADRRAARAAHVGEGTERKPDRQYGRLSPRRRARTRRPPRRRDRRLRGLAARRRVNPRPISTALVALLAATALTACDRTPSKTGGTSVPTAAKSERVPQEVGGIEGATP